MGEGPDNQQKEPTDDWWDGYYLRQLETWRRSIDLYDSTLMALSGGALGVSMTFVNDFVDRQRMTCEGLLIVAWLLWAFSLLLVLYGHYESCGRHEKAIELALKRDAEKLRELAGDRSIQRHAKWSGLTFALGLLLFVVFIFINQIQ